MSFDSSLALKYLGLPSNYTPSPQHEPVAFLTRHLSQLPPHILTQFSNITTPKHRTLIFTIRNRRLEYTSKLPKELSFEAARTKWPQIWTSREPPGREEGKDEKEWANLQFLGGQQQHVGKLGTLLGEYEEEREAERARTLRRPRIVEDFIAEEEDDDDEDFGIPEEETEGEARASFERLIRERFIYGLLEASVVPV